MDKKTPSIHTPATTSHDSMVKPAKSKKTGLKVFGITLGVILLIIGSLYLGYWYRGTKAKTEADQHQQKMQEIQDKNKLLEEEKAKLQTELDELKKSQQSTTNSTTTGTVSANTKANIIDAVKSGNSAALESYMASTVRVIIAASEGVGDRTPSQAINDMNYLNSATAPWNFALPAATLTTWQAGPYTQYFPSNAVVGKSVNNYVISFSFNGAGKISTIFMANNATLLTD